MGKKHVVVMDNFFILVGLLEELVSDGTYVIATICLNRVGIL